MNQPPAHPSEGELHALKRRNLRTICDGWEKITRYNAACDEFWDEVSRKFSEALESSQVPEGN